MRQKDKRDCKVPALAAWRDGDRDTETQEGRTGFGEEDMHSFTL